MTWRELAGDGRLAKALEACEEQGRDALPLAAKELHRLFPELGGTKKAAEGWARKNPRFGAKPAKKIVDRQAASPSSWKTPFIATWMAW